MKKALVIGILTVLSTTTYARIENFDEMIDEGNRSRRDIAATVQKKVDGGRKPLRDPQAKGQPQVVIDNSYGEYTAPSAAGIGNFEKEKARPVNLDQTHFDHLQSEMDLMDE